jgi:hypothetical protein
LTSNHIHKVAHFTPEWVAHFTPEYSPGRSSDEVSVMGMEPRAWLVGVLNRQQLKAISG